MLDLLFTAIVEFLGRWGYWGIAVGMALENACVPLPGELLLPVGGFLAASGQMRFAAVFMAGQLGGLAGTAITYWLGRAGGRGLLARYGRFLPISQRGLEWAERWFAERGEATVFLARMVPGLRTFISLPAGVSGMEFGRFLFYSFMGMLPWSLAFTWAGYRLGQNREQLRAWLHRLDHLAAGLLLAAAAGLVWHRLRQRPVWRG